jgi:FixJ family two-component response regulator
MKGGAVDFLTKPVDSDIFVDAVRRALACDVEQRTSMEEADADRAALGTLTPREREILPYLVSGKLNKQIAADLGVAEKTVKVHRTHVMGKLGAPSRADLVRLVDRLHIAPIPCVGRTGN